MNNSLFVGQALRKRGTCVPLHVYHESGDRRRVRGLDPDSHVPALLLDISEQGALIFVPSSKRQYRCAWFQGEHHLAVEGMEPWTFCDAGEGCCSVRAPTSSWPRLLRQVELGSALISRLTSMRVDVFYFGVVGSTPADNFTHVGALGYGTEVAFPEVGDHGSQLCTLSALRLAFRLSRLSADVLDIVRQMLGLRKQRGQKRKRPASCGVQDIVRGAVRL